MIQIEVNTQFLQYSWQWARRDLDKNSFESNCCNFGLIFWSNTTRLGFQVNCWVSICLEIFKELVKYFVNSYGASLSNMLEITYGSFTQHYQWHLKVLLKEFISYAYGIVRKAMVLMVQKICMIRFQNTWVRYMFLILICFFLKIKEPHHEYIYIYTRPTIL